MEIVREIGRVAWVMLQCFSEAWLALVASQSSFQLHGQKSQKSMTAKRRSADGEIKDELVVVISEAFYVKCTENSQFGFRLTDWIECMPVLPDWLKLLMLTLWTVKWASKNLLVPNCGVVTIWCYNIYGILLVMVQESWVDKDIYGIVKKSAVAGFWKSILLWGLREMFPGGDVVDSAETLWRLRKILFGVVAVDAAGAMCGFRMNISDDIIGLLVSMWAWEEKKVKSITCHLVLSGVRRPE